MKKNKIFISTFLIVFAIMIAFCGFKDKLNKKPIEMQEMTLAEVIEYEESDQRPSDEESDLAVEEDVKKEKAIATTVASNEGVDADEFCICVYGKSTLSLSPDCAKITASIERLNSDMMVAKEENFKAYEKVLAEIKKVGGEDEEIVLDHFSCHPSIDYSNGQKITGYYCNSTFTIKVNSLDKIKDYIDVLTENEVTNIRDINYQISDIEEQYNNALISAVENAKSKAAKILGKEDLKIVSVKEQYIYSSNNLYRTYSGELSSNDMIGKVEIQAEVLVEFN